MIEQILQADRYLQVDQVEKARDAYQKVVDLDPANSIAVVGLARCALSEGDDQQAYQLAARALEIDPENDMARRMEARLSEILATRGEPVERPGVATAPGPQDMRPVVTGETPAVERPTSAVTSRPAPAAAAAAQDVTSTSATAARPKEPPVRKSIFDRLLGR